MPQNTPASRDKPEDSNKPSVAAANPLLDSLMATPTKRAEVKAKTPSLTETAGAFTNGVVEAGIGTLAIVTRKDSSNGAVLNAAHNIFDMVKDPLRTATGIKDQTVKAYQTVKSGDVLGIAHLSGALAFTVGTAGLGSSGTVARVGARTEALIGVEQALGRTAAARALVSDAGAVLRTAGNSIDDLALAGTGRIPNGLLTEVAETTVKSNSIISTVRPIGDTLKSIFSPSKQSLASQLDNFGNGRAFAGTETGAAKVTPRVAEVPSVTPKAVEAPAVKSVGEVAPTTPKLTGEVPGIKSVGEATEYLTVANQVVESSSSALRTQSRNLAEVVEQSGAGTINAGRGAVGEKLTAAVKELDEILERGPKLSSQTTAREVESVVKRLESKEFDHFFAENPRAAQLLQDIKGKSTALREAATTVEKAALPNASTAFHGPEITANLTDNLATKGPVAQTAAEQGLAKIEGIGSRLTESGVRISDEVASSLQTVERSLKAIAEKGATPQVVDDLTRAMRAVEQNLGKEVLDSTAGKGLLETRQAVNSIVAAEAERSSIGQIKRSLNVMEESGLNLRRQNGDFAQLLQETAPTAKNTAVVDRLNGTVRKIDEVLESSAQPVAKAREIQQLVKQFERPEFHQFFVENPRAARLLEDMKGSTSTIGNSAIKVESSALALERIQTVAKFGEQTTAVATKVERLASSFADEVKLPNVATDLKQISDDLKAIKNGANPELAMSSVRNRIEAIEAGGAPKLAQELKNTVSELERGSAAVSRVQRMEASVGAIEREAGKIGTQAEKLSSGLADKPNVNAGVKPVASVEAKVAEHLDFISQQSKNLTYAVDDLQAVTRIQRSLAEIDELGGKALFTGEKAIAYRELKQSVATLDRAAVEAQGLRAFDNSTQAIARGADEMLGVTARISDNSALRGDLVKVERAAAEVKAATTFEQQSAALKKLSGEIDDPRLQSSLSKSIEGRQVLDELKVGVNNLKQNLEVRALERATVKIEAQAPAAIKAAQGLEQALAKDATLSNNSPLKQAVADYAKAAENLAVRSERSAAIKQMDQQLAIIEREVQGLKVPGPTTTTTTELNALRQSHKIVTESVSDAGLLAQSILEKRLPHVENLLSQVGVSTSSTVQRELIRQTAGEIQTLRYLGGDTAAKITMQLEQAQANLVSAANQLEVAAYSRSLIKLAANGDAVAAGKLLFAGLTSDGFRTTFRDFLAVRGNMVPFIGGDVGGMMRRLSASDDVFALNRAAIFNPNVVRAASGATMALGFGSMFVTGGMLDAREAMRQAERQNFAPDARVPQNVEASGTEARVDSNADTNNDTNTEAKADTKDRTGVPDVVAVSAQAVASKPDTTFSTNGQAVVRNAYSAEMRYRATPSSASYSPLSPVIRAAAFNKDSAPKSEVGAFGLDLRDPDYHQKKFLMAAYGADHFIGKGAEPTSTEINNLVFLANQQVNWKTNGVVRTDGTRFEKPARDAFAINPALSLTSPISLMNSGANGRNNGPSAFGNNTSGTLGVSHTGTGTRSSSDTKQLFSSLAAAASEGGSGRGKVTEGEERTEADVLEQGSTGTSSNNTAANLANDDDEDGDGGSGNSVSPTVVAQSGAPQNNIDPQVLQPREVLTGPPKKRQSVNQAV